MREPLSICFAGLGLAEVEPELRPREAEFEVLAAGRASRVAAVFCAGAVARVDVAVVGRGVRLFTVFCRFTLLTFTLLTFTFRLTLTFTLLERGAYTLAGAR